MSEKKDFTKNEMIEEVDSIVREDSDVFANELKQSVQNVNNDMTFNGRVRLRNQTADPRSGRPGEIIMVNGTLKTWDSTSSAWVTVGGGGDVVTGGNGAMTSYIGAVVGTTGAPDTPFPAGWTSSRTSIGVYVVTHNLGNSNDYVVAISMDDTTQDNRVVYERDANSFDVEVTDETGAYDDGNFTFIVHHITN